ncbi:alpha-arrestin [Aspergillus stella-maris]|uniref:alpha-arrestin n=1 Tax=Aspergillus stella-maris TaxID=1810926 RepID=UPI003CCE4D60
MPGRLLSSLVRPSLSHHSIFPHSNSSSSSSVNEVSHTAPSKNSHSRPHSPERRLSFSMDHFIHTYRDHNKEKKRHGRSKERVTHEAVATSAKLDVIVESPPLICYGTPQNSTGALFSGRLRINVAEAAGVTLDKFDMRLVIKKTTKKPVSRDCPHCASKTEELTNWNFLTEPLPLKSGNHDFPFSYLFPGNLPASCNSTLGQVEYFLEAHGHNINGEDYTFKMPVNIRRAILPGNDKSSIRIFPPTNLTGRIVLPSVVHPIGTFPVQMTLSGVLDKGEETQTRWRLRKMMWRIEEHQKIVSEACSKHTHKIGGEGKGVLHRETRIIGHNEEKEGWKTDFDTAGGEISMEFEANINPTSNPVCDLEVQGGVEAKHNLVIELIVAEEFCPNRNTRLITPTGAARVLRMQFNLHVTERSGLGISWDEEMPPVYEDVPASPPGYTMLGSSVMEDYHGSPLATPDYEDLERMDSLRLDTSSTNSSCRGRSRLTTDDLTTEPAEITNRNRAPSADSQSS